MRVNAYILAADPAWIEASVSAYYDCVDRIVVSYDGAYRGWTGAAVDVEECLRRLRAIDPSGKCDYRSGQFARPEFFSRPIENDTHQRQVALDQASEGADWVLQLDTDEVLPCAASLVALLGRAEGSGVPAVEWPMRVLFRGMRNRQYLEVCAAGGMDRFEYPGPIAVKPGVRLVDARRTDGPFVRPVVAGDDRSLQLRQPVIPGEQRWECLDSSDAIIHNSWARDAASIRSKIASWGHNEGLKSWMFYYLRWKPAPLIWPWLRDFHPFAGGLWPALKLSRALPHPIGDECMERLA